MIKRLAAATLLLLLAANAYGQKKWFDEALKKGRQGEFYIIVNPKKKDLSFKKCREYAEKMDYLLGEYTKQSINKYGNTEYVVATLQFVPRIELYEQIYNELPLAGKVPFSQLKRGGRAYYFRGIEKGVRQLMNNEELEGRVNLSRFLNTSLDWYYFASTDTLYWSGNVKDGMIDGPGTAFCVMLDGYYYFRGTFDRGFPVGECTVYRYVGPWQKCCDDYSLYSQSCRLSKFENGFATFEAGEFKGYINRSGSGNLTPEQQDFYSSHAVAYYNNGEIYFHYFDTRHTEEDRIAVGQIMKEKAVLEKRKLLISNKKSIPQFYKEELAQAGNHWSRIRLQQVMEELRQLYDNGCRLAELDSMLCVECRREGMLYEYSCLSKNPAFLTDQEREALADRMFFEFSYDLLADKYLAFFKDGKYKGKDIKELAERLFVLNNTPQTLSEKYGNKYTGKNIDEMWLQAYIDNAHDLLERNDPKLWEKINEYEGDITKNALLTEDIGSFMTNGIFGFFSGTGYVFPATKSIGWYSKLFYTFQRNKIRNIEEALKYKALVDGIALANRTDDYLLSQIEDNERYFCSLDNINSSHRSSHKERMQEAINVAREFAVTKPELAPACNAAAILIKEKKDAIEFHLDRVREDWYAFFAARAKRIRDNQCKNCTIISEKSPSLVDDDHKKSEKEGEIVMGNYRKTWWVYVKDALGVEIETYGLCNGRFKSYNAMIDAIIKACVKEYCD